MNIIEAPDNLNERWDEFIKANAPDGGLLQSWRWGDFQKSLGNKIFRLALLDGGGEIKAATLLIKHEMPFEYNYLYCPRGPVATSIVEKQDLTKIFDDIKRIAKEEKSFMIRLDPPWSQGNQQKLEDLGFRRSEYEIQPKCNFIINISRSEEEILAQMKQKTRYNIGLAQRHGVKIRVSKESSDIEVFWQLMKQTAKRDSFNPHPKEHYKKIFDIFSHDQTIQLFLAEYDNKTVAASMVSFFGQFATYLHGASSDLYREIMAPYLMQWQAIQEAKKLDCLYYDFGGVNGQTFYDKKWDGMTRFKTGFAPEVTCKEYVGSYELILSPVIFAAYKFVKQFRG